MSNMTTKQAIGRQWSNGGRWMLLSAGLAFLGVVLVGVLLVALSIARPQEWTPLRYPVPQLALTAVVAPGDEVIVIGEKCNEGDEPVTITGTRAFQRIDPPGRTVAADGTGVRVLEPGCHGPVGGFWLNQAPASLTPGVWRIVGVDTGIGPEGQTQTVPYWSTEFEVVAP